MKRTTLATCLAAMFVLVLAGPAPAQTWKSLLGQATGSEKPKSESGEKKDTITEDQASQGLKEALEVGARKAVELASAKDGFFGNELIRIPLPKPIRSAGDTLRRFGLGKTVDEFELSMNRAAEAASAKATPILIDAVKGLTVEDGLDILKGGDTAATDLLRSRTEEQLTKELEPIVTKAMEDAKVTHYYDQLQQKGGSILDMMGQKPVDLDEYVTGKTLDGLFTLIGEEEKKIRKDPVARTTDLLKEVFGSLGQ
ncbi:MAG TPA: DUF4197 domain-containing protein [Acidobacteria bacterium]|nr:DUF4197 domain-containing protein [Acidobacteriota bacterium]